MKLHCLVSAALSVVPLLDPPPQLVCTLLSRTRQLLAEPLEYCMLLSGVLRPQLICSLLLEKPLLFVEPLVHRMLPLPGTLPPSWYVPGCW